MPTSHGLPNMGCDGLAVWPRHVSLTMLNVLGICSHEQLHVDSFVFAEPSLLKSVGSLNDGSVVFAFPWLELASPTIRSARCSHMVYFYVSGILQYQKRFGGQGPFMGFCVCVCSVLNWE